MPNLAASNPQQANELTFWASTQSMSIDGRIRYSIWSAELSLGISQAEAMETSYRAKISSKASRIGFSIRLERLKKAASDQILTSSRRRHSVYNRARHLYTSTTHTHTCQSKRVHPICRLVMLRNARVRSAIKFSHNNRPIRDHCSSSPTRFYGLLHLLDTTQQKRTRQSRLVSNIGNRALQISHRTSRCSGAWPDFHSLRRSWSKGTYR